MAEYRKIAELGEGTYGKVYLVKRIDTRDNESEYVALKRLFTNKSRHTGILCLRELEIVTTCNHPNLATASRVLHTSPFHTLSPRKGYRSDKVYLEFPLACCDLDYLISNEYKSMTSTLMCDIMVQVTRGLHYLHTQGIMHRDIKPNNVLVYIGDDEESLVFRLADFGAAKPYVSSEKNTPKLFYIEYRAPELLLKERYYGFEPDVWALGCVFVEIVTKVPPFPSQKNTPNLVQLTKIVNTVGTSDYIEDLAKQRGVSIHKEQKKVKGLSNIIKKNRQQEFDASSASGTISWTQWLKLIGRMLDTDIHRRATTKDVLVLLGDSSDSCANVQTMINIRDCPCRTKALMHLKSCKLSNKWYDHCVDVINRVTYTSNHDAKHLIIATVSIVSKYWSIEMAASLSELLSNDLGSFRGSRLEEYELTIVRDILEYKIYRPLLSDLVNVRVPRSVVIDLGESVVSNGYTIEQLAVDVNRKYTKK